MHLSDESSIAIDSIICTIAKNNAAHWRVSITMKHTGDYLITYTPSPKLQLILKAQIYY